jgi:hypothetical protein
MPPHLRALDQSTSGVEGIDEDASRETTALVPELPASHNILNPAGQHASAAAPWRFYPSSQSWGRASATGFALGPDLLISREVCGSDFSDFVSLNLMECTVLAS